VRERPWPSSAGVNLSYGRANAMTENGGAVVLGSSAFRQRDERRGWTPWSVVCLKMEKVWCEVVISPPCGGVAVTDWPNRAGRRQPQAARYFAPVSHRWAGPAAARRRIWRRIWSVGPRAEGHALVFGPLSELVSLLGIPIEATGDERVLTPGRLIRNRAEECPRVDASV
jgi:hypothetical protein